jgi:hypothetical protein
MFSIRLNPCTCQTLAHVLDPAVPFVWLCSHIPQTYLKWWHTQLPLSVTGRPHDVETRFLRYELQLTTPRFLELLPEFENQGISVFQMTRRVPDTLTLNRVPDRAVNGVLIQNGLHLRVSLSDLEPWGEVQSPNRVVLEKILQKPELKRVGRGTP